jgi:O-antigen ligase
VARAARAGAAPVWNRADTSPYRKLAVWLFWAIMARLIIPGFFEYGRRLDVDMADEGEALFNHLTWLLFFVVSAFLVVNRSGAALRLLRATNGPFVALLLFALCSLAWSIDPAATAARLFHVATVLLAGMAAATFGWHPRRYQEIVRPVITFFLLGSLIFGLVAPDLAIQQPVPPETHSFWGGLTIGKNALGAIASAGVILWVHGWASREVKPLPALCGTALSLALLVLSRAATHMMATAVVCGLIVVMLRSSRGMRPFTPYLVAFLAAMTITYGLVILDVVPGLDILLDPITALTGKDRTFTNRALIWEITRQHISQSPIIGTGYGGFWAHVGPGTPAYAFAARMFFNPGECHDGYLEIVNDLGFVGLALLLAYLAAYLKAALRLLTSDYVQASLLLGLLFQQVISGLTESNWLWVGPDFLMFTFATLCLARQSMDYGPRRAARGSSAPSIHARRAGIAGR